ncbi:MAG: glycosyltransferase [Kiritimatiellaeota bacterium]|nr:glycosyltransferase [Kiritimatiellota bacterium]
MTTENDKNIWQAARTCLGASGSLSVIMPAYGLETVIGRNIETVCGLLRGNIPFEVLPVDDGSADHTADAIRTAAARDPEHVRPVYVKVNAGKGNALRRGFEASRGTHILLLDGDLDLSPTRVTTFFDIMLGKRAAIVVGSKRHPDSVIDYPWTRRLASSVYYTMVRLLVGLPITDTQTGMKLFSRDALQWSFDRMLVKAFAFDLEVLSIAHAKGFTVAEAPIEMHFGNKVGSLTWTNVKQVMIDTLAIFYRLRVLRYYESVEVAPAPAAPITVSVVIACPAPSAYLTECLNALAAQTYPHFEVLVLPDGEGENIQYPTRNNQCPSEMRYGAMAGRATAETGASVETDDYPSPKVLQNIQYPTRNNQCPSEMRHEAMTGRATAGKGASVETDDYPSPKVLQNNQCPSEMRSLDIGYSVLDIGHSSPFPLSIIPTGKTRPAEKRNIGIRAAKGEVVAFLDDDAYPVPNWLEHAVKYFALDDVGGVGGPGVTPPNDPFLAQAGGRVYANRLVSGNYRYRYTGDRVRPNIDDYPSCNLFIRTSLLNAIGGYRTDFWPGEDTILCADVVLRHKKRIVYDPWAIVYHHRRPLFLPHLRQIGRYALHRGHFAKRFPDTSLRLSYLIPTLFVLGVVIGAPLALLHPWIRYAYLGALSCYALITFIASFTLSLPMWIVTWLGVMATHTVYGIRFLLGLLSRRMPCEVAAFDHPMEKRSK